MLLFLSAVHGSKSSYIKMCCRSFFLPMQCQYSSHTSLLIEKLLCQHSMLMGKVTVSLGGGLGTGREGELDRTRCGRTEGGMLSLWYPVRTPGTSDTAEAAVHLIL